MKAKLFSLMLVVVLLSGLMACDPDTPPVAPNASTATPTDLPLEQLPPLVVLTEQDSTAVSVDGQVVTDTNNVSASVSDGSVQGADVVHLLAYQPPEAFDADLEQNGWKRQSPLYTLAVGGEGENIGGAELSFPANSAEDRLALLLDDRFVVPMEGVLPQDGRLTVQAFVKPGSGEPLMEGGGTHYFVISPTSKTSVPAGGSLAASVFALAGQPSFGLQAKLTSPQPAGKIYCNTNWIYTSCTDTLPGGNGRPKVYLLTVVDLKTMPGMEAVLQQFIGTFLEQVDAYNQQGFTQVPRQFLPAFIRITDRAKDPGYDPVTGNIYINMKAVTGITTNLSNQAALAHELFHWIEAQRYWMILNSLSASLRWDMEMRADVGTFLINPKFQVAHLISKGTATDAGSKKMGWQENLFDWDVEVVAELPIEKDEERYIQAQIARMGLCPANMGKCIYSLQEFITDVNNGTSNWNKEGFRGSLENVADYLLGYPSNYTEGVYDVNDPVLQNGWNYGDYIWAGQYGKTTKPEVLPGTYTQVNAQTGEVTIDTVVASGAIYPLRVSNGASAPNAQAMGRKPDAPYRLTIEAGIPFYYVLDNQGGVQYWDGGKSKTFEPITSEKMVKMVNAGGHIVEVAGISNVRIVAVNAAADEVKFKATFRQLPPVISADPKKITLTTPQDEVEIQVTVSQIAMSTKSFTAVWDYGDGSPEEQIKTNPDKNMQAVIAVKHIFKGVGAKKVVVYFLDDQDKPMLNWDTVIIPVGGTFTLTPTATPIPTVTPIATPTLAGDLSTGYWLFVEPNQGYSPDPAPAPDTGTTSVGANSMSGSYLRAGDPSWISAFECSWTWNSPGGMEKLVPGETLKLSMTLTDLGDWENSNSGSLIRFDKPYNGSRYVDAGSVDWLSLLVYRKDKGTVSQTVDITIPSGPPVSRWNNRMGIKSQCGSAYGFGGYFERVYEWVPPGDDRTQNPTQDTYVSGFAGSWDTDFGDMTCSVDGQKVNCNYTFDNGKIEATLLPDGITMEGSWSESPSYQPPADGGKVTFTLSADGNSITGYWWYGPAGEGGAWNGTRK